MPIPIGAITGIKSFAINVSMIVGSADTTSPTYPISLPPESFFCTFRSPESLPLIPTALSPSFCIIDTRLLLTLESTISATSNVSSSVTRRPFTNSDSLPIFFSHALISLPPPCTMIGSMPISFNKATSLITLYLRFSSTIALPPYLTTTRLPLNFCMYGSASISVCAFASIISIESLFTILFSSVIPVVFFSKNRAETGTYICYYSSRSSLIFHRFCPCYER